MIKNAKQRLSEYLNIDESQCDCDCFAAILSEFKSREIDELRSAMLKQSGPEPAQVSQEPVAYGDRLGTDLQNVYAAPSTGVPKWMSVMTPLFTSPPDYEALKAENEALKLRVAELQRECDQLRNRPFECWSKDDGDSWGEHPADGEFVDGLKVGDTFELLAGYESVRVKYVVTKAPDDIDDDYEVEQAK